MTEQEVERELSCECGGNFHYYGYDTIDIEEGYLVIRGICICNKCRKEMKYEESHMVELGCPDDLFLEEIEDEE